MTHVTILMASAAALSLATATTRPPTPDPSIAPARPRHAEATGVVEVPYRRVKDQALVDVHIKGQGPFTFLIDTGVAGAAIDVDLAARLGVALDEDMAQTMRMGHAKDRLFYQTWIEGLSVGALKLDSLQAAALPMKALGDMLGEPLHGILGSGFLKTRATRFDHSDRTVAFAPSMGAFDEDVRATQLWVPLGIGATSDMPVVEVTLHGRTFNATVDTGSSLGLEIFTPYAEELGLGAVAKEWKPIKVLGGSLGEATSYEGTVERIDIGPLRFENVPTSVTPARFDAHRKGNLGNRLWDGHVLIFDYPAGVLVIRRKS